MYKILFVCIENANRSQLAEAYMKKYAPDFEVFSAGSEPKIEINQLAKSIIQKLDLKNEIFYPKTFTAINPQVKFDYIVSMGCGEQCPQIPADNRIEWDIPDPKSLNYIEYLKIAQLIENNIIELIESINIH
ncbi:MAG: arsenate reductase ArsC [Dehalococcoidia bacterium]|jgi:protein-tyrosine-phosphatase|nr:arsenate reductase ArsC [Dehalococcoidia bacterium]